jgi:hypothetical protein
LADSIKLTVLYEDDMTISTLITKISETTPRKTPANLTTFNMSPSATLSVARTLNDLKGNSTLKPSRKIAELILFLRLNENHSTIST